jgi:hypothetical protein
MRLFLRQFLPRVFVHYLFHVCILLIYKHKRLWAAHIIEETVKLSDASERYLHVAIGVVA